MQAGTTGFAEYLDRPYSASGQTEKIHDILEENKLKPEETLFIGDMQHDIETAKHGGIHSCAVLTGYNGIEQLRASRPGPDRGTSGRTARNSRTQTTWNCSPCSRNEERIAVVTVGALDFQ